MVCVYCGHKTQVTNSRHLVRNNTVWRRRRCLSCDAVFTSREAPDLAASLMIDDAGTLSPFMREKLFISIYESCRHRDLAAEDASGLTDTVLARIQHKVIDSGVVALSGVTDTAYETLRNFDPVAATYYKAYFCKK
jgi:transcriptional repressor NrdR